MKIIKLNAIDSTNSFLKDLVKNSVVENFTVVVTDNQTKGRGQQESVWYSEPFKNLTFSVFCEFENLDIRAKIKLNFAISLALYEALFEEEIPNVFIKWPNDILSGNSKICGILVENTLKGHTIKSAIIGVGLNVNQTNFTKTTKKISSLRLLTGKRYDLDILLQKILVKLKLKLELLHKKDFKNLETSYLKFLYKKNTPAMFKDSKGVLFMGLIRGVSKDGLLQVELENESIKEFGIKEISFA